MLVVLLFQEGGGSENRREGGDLDKGQGKSIGIWLQSGALETFKVAESLKGFLKTWKLNLKFELIWSLM